MNDTIDIIQQWQYTGKVAPELLDDAAYINARENGITSLQSYVLWSEIEPVEGKTDFSTYDPVVEQCKKHGLKWVPFIILGPNYSVPEWYHASSDSVYAACMDHGISSRIQSIWNPDLPERVERFVGLLSERYRNSGVIQSIVLGISGNWGETLFPIDGCFRPGFHTHLGWWCNDSYAHASYQEYLKDKYRTIKNLRKAHGRLYRDFPDVSAPFFHSRTGTGTSGRIHTRLKKMINKYFFIVNRILRNRIFEKRWGLAFTRFFKWHAWFDFTDWYTSSMTSWCEFWLGVARRYFPDQRVYLATGGEGWLEGGAVFSQQMKTAKRFNAGIRITNQSDTFADSCILARLVSTAARFYDAYYHTEEAWINTPHGVTARLFDAMVSGADGFYCKNLIGIGFDICSKKAFPVGQATDGAESLARYGKLITGRKPDIEVAVLFPSTSIAFGTQIHELMDACKDMRRMFDFDLIDEWMIQDGALDKYRFLIIPFCKWMRGDTVGQINQWVLGGGIMVSTASSRIHNIDRPGFNVSIFKKESVIEKFGKGFCLNPGKDTMNGRRGLLREMLYNTNDVYPYAGINHFVIDRDGIFWSFVDTGVVIYNETDTMIDQECVYYRDKRIGHIRISMDPHSISVYEAR